MTTAPAILDPPRLIAALAKLPDWRHRLGALHAAFALPSAAAAVRLVATIGTTAESVRHHPDVDWRYDHVFVRTTTHQAGGEVTERDVSLAATVSELAAAAGGTAVPTASRSIEIAIDTTDPEPIIEAWRVALGYRRDESGALVDPWGRGPNLWFQQTERPDQSRIHVDVHVAQESARAAVEAVAAAGGRILDAHNAPAWWVIADQDGNRFCLCTPQDPGRPQETAAAG